MTEEVEWYPGPDDVPFFFVLIVPLVPLFAIPAKIISEEGGTITIADMAVPLIGGVIYSIYLLAWLASRMKTERRFGLYADRMWLPASEYRLNGLFVPYSEISEVSGARYFTIVYSGKTRRFRPSGADRLAEAIQKRLT